jgi:hypothetical protein
MGFVWVGPPDVRPVICGGNACVELMLACMGVAEGAIAGAQYLGGDH